ncbi:MAG TPA: creatininase family protein [Actinopolymorphaceae bacterium]|jgi:creatinine amidohydrolase
MASDNLAVARWRELDRQTLTELLPDAVVVLPIGATEQHGPHLATGTDALLAETVATRAAERAAARCDRRLVVTPTIPIGASDHHLPFGGTLSLRPETLLDVLLDVIRSVATCGGRRLVIVNGHGGNRGICSAAAAAAATRWSITVAYLDYWELAGEAERGDLAVPGHAGRFETSLVLAVAPDWVGSASRRTTVPSTPAVDGLELHRQATWDELAGYTDQPADADASLGAALLDKLVEALTTRLVELAKAV